jgi:trimeric autotransporter adhesin
MKKAIQIFTLSFLLGGSLYAQDPTTDKWTDNGANIVTSGLAFTGSVGIGTAAPASKLHIMGSSLMLERNDLLNDPQTQRNRLRISITESPFPNAALPGNLNGLAGGSINFSAQPIINSTNTSFNGALTPDMSFSANGQNLHLIIKNNGKIVMGNVSTNTAYAYRLYVENGILTERLKVALKSNTDWADYVFAEDYKLQSLKEIEQYIKKNKHLPGVPSANDLVTNGGIDMNEMFAKQMEKIEELTLHIIELNKKIERLELEVNHSPLTK